MSSSFRRGDRVHVISGTAGEIVGPGTIFRGPYHGEFLVCVWDQVWTWVPMQFLQFIENGRRLRSDQSPDAADYRSPFEPNAESTATICIRNLDAAAVEQRIRRLLLERVQTVVLHGNLPCSAASASEIEVERMARRLLGDQISVVHLCRGLRALGAVGTVVAVSCPTLACMVPQRERIRTVDLHSRLRDQPLVHAREALEEAYRLGVVQLLLIHGKGRHNLNGRRGVLREEIESLLTAMQRRLQCLRYALCGRNRGRTAVVFE